VVVRSAAINCTGSAAINTIRGRCTPTGDPIDIRLTNFVDIVDSDWGAAVYVSAAALVSMRRDSFVNCTATNRKCVALLQNVKATSSVTDSCAIRCNGDLGSFVMFSAGVAVTLRGLTVFGGTCDEGAFRGVYAQVTASRSNITALKGKGGERRVGHASARARFIDEGELPSIRQRHILLRRLLRVERERCEFLLLHLHVLRRRGVFARLRLSN
jgi:uncharacterized protein (AIM24 family)